MVLLPWTPPYDWGWMVGFLQARGRRRRAFS
ncbi:DNA-3-methyladenine glycosylase II [Klebsiella quasipneumoniae]|nr:DNA-3-methyladenine glycosylase II [Klebsiella quasipneumoniae]SCA37791.1 DNA-3-methyladenine glycosylase II [Klebsiella quasipneumoniae]